MSDKNTFFDAGLFPFADPLIKVNQKKWKGGGESDTFWNQN